MKLDLNPILDRELKERMRSHRAPLVITVFLMLLGLIVFLTERAVMSDTGSFVSTAVAGRAVFHYLLAGLLFLVIFMVPGYTAGTVSLERERQTFHLVQVTMLRPRQIVLGKFGASFSYLMFLVLITLPFVSISFVLGGVTPLDVVRAYAMVLLTGVTIAFLCIAVSSRARRTVGATVLCYSLVMMLTLGTGVVFGLAKVMQEQSRDRAIERGEVPPDPTEPTWALVLNPFFGTASAIQGKQSGGGRGETPFTGIFSFLAQASRRGYAFDPAQSGGQAFVVTGSSSSGPIAIQRGGRPFAQPTVVTPQPDDGRIVPFWAWTVGWYVLLSAFGFALSVRAVHSPAGKLRLPKVRKRRNVVADA